MKHIRKDRRGEWSANKSWACAILLVVLIFTPIVWAFWPAPVPPTDETFDVWDAQAPFGHYWVSTQGEGSWWHFEMWSNLQESYIIKYMQNGELKTAIFPSSATTITGENRYNDDYTTYIVPHVYLENQNVTPTFRMVSQFSHKNYGFGNCGQPIQIDYYLTLPDPKVF